jgi:hypothetical protein
MPRAVFARMYRVEPSRLRSAKVPELIRQWLATFG